MRDPAETRNNCIVPVSKWPEAIEFMAQCVAAHEGMLARADGRVLPLGFLVGVKGLRLGASRFDRDEELRVWTRRIRGRPGLGILSHSCAISREGAGPEDEVIAEGRLSIVVDRTENRLDPARELGDYFR